MFHPRFVALAAFVLVAACSDRPPVVQPVDETSDAAAIVFSPKQISAETSDCASDGPHCARVQITTIETAGGGTRATRDNIDLYLGHDLVSRLRSFLPEEAAGRSSSPEALAAEFLAQHRAFVAEFPDSPAMWSIEITGKSLYNTTTVATIDITEFAYTGGAHPNTRRRLASFDVSSGLLLGVDDLTADTTDLTAIVEDRLRADLGLGPDDDLETAGFWLPESGFTLPDNVGIVSNGVLFHWDPYEIAPYAMGPIDVIIPSAELGTIADQRFWRDGASEQGAVTPPQR